MKIGHRGAAGHAPENTIKSLLAAIDFKVDGIEFDVRLTRDDQLVLCHNADLKDVAGLEARVADLSLKDIQKVTTRHGEPIPSLDQALLAVGSMPVVIELKDKHSVEALSKVLRKHPDAKISITSFQHDEIAAVRRKLPHLPVFLSAHTDPFSVIQRARGMKAKGITLNYWIINPLTYLLARRAGLDILVYTVNNRQVGHFLQRLYPGIQICTNFPDRIPTPPSVKAKG